MEGISRCSYNFCDPNLCFHFITPDNILELCSDFCEEDHPHKHFCNCEEVSKDGKWNLKKAENSVKVEDNLPGEFNDEEGIANIEDNSDENEEDLTRELNSLRGLLDENLERKLRKWDEDLKSLGTEIEEASFKILQKRG